VVITDVVSVIMIQRPHNHDVVITDVVSVIMIQRERPASAA
jgi:hypothetical protein